MLRPGKRGTRQLTSSRVGLVLAGFLAVAGYFLWAEHQAHLLGYLPLLAFLGVCLGMHFFMHGGHGSGHGGSGDSKDRRGSGRSDNDGQEEAD